MTYIGTKQLTTDRLILRKFELSDVPSAYKLWAGVEEIQTGYGEPTYDSEDKTRELISAYIEKSEAQDYYRWAIILKETGECVGQIAFFLVNTNCEFAEIEYCVSKEYWGRGIAPEAAKEVLRFGFEDVGFNRIQICCRENNLSSKRVIEKCGLKYEGALRQYFKCADGFHDRLYFSLLRNEYNKERK